MHTPSSGPPDKVVADIINEVLSGKTVLSVMVQ